MTISQRGSSAGSSFVPGLPRLVENGVALAPASGRQSPSDTGGAGAAINPVVVASAAKPANVFQIGSGWFPELKGGAENVFFNLYRGLSRQGFTVRGIVPSANDVVPETNGMMRGFVTQGTSQPRRAVAIRRTGLKSFADAQPDLVASHFALYSLPLLDRLAKLPLVTHFHGPWALESAVEGHGAVVVRTKKALETLIYKRASRVIVLSSAFADLVQEHYGVRDSVIRLVPGGVDCDQFDSSLSSREARAALGWENDRPVVFAVRRLVRRMGLDRLVEAMAMLRDMPSAGSRDAILHIAGTGPERGALEALAAARGLSDVVRFDGRVAEHLLPLAYRAADVTLLPTAGLEGFGLAAVESLAAGTPVLVTPVGGLPEVVSDLSTSMLLNGTDARSIANGIAAAIADASFLPNSEACRGYARRNFDWSVLVPKVAAVYREVL